MLVRLRKHTRQEMVRKPRGLDELERWKATELRNFLLYFGPFVLKNQMEKRYYEHFLKLSIAVSILASPRLCQVELALAEKLLREFVLDAEDLYDSYEVARKRAIRAEERSDVTSEPEANIKRTRRPPRPLDDYLTESSSDEDPTTEESTPSDHMEFLDEPPQAPLPRNSGSQSIGAREKDCDGNVVCKTGRAETTSSNCTPQPCKNVLLTVLRELKHIKVQLTSQALILSRIERKVNGDAPAAMTEPARPQDMPVYPVGTDEELARLEASLKNEAIFAMLDSEAHTAVYILNRCLFIFMLAAIVTQELCDVLNQDGRVRICGDFKVTINPVATVEKYLLPRIDLWLALSRGQRFSKLDLRDAYQQLVLQDAARKYVTISTTMGLFQYTRLPFGMASAPAIFQREIDNLFRGMRHVAVCLDDILVTGTDDGDLMQSLRRVQPLKWRTIQL
ncbi:uncharacterized protein ISCGN_023262 [Ixodes scapularis]